MTSPDTSSQPKYEFAEKYDSEHAKKYFEKHNTGFWRRLSALREVDTARKALANLERQSSMATVTLGTGHGSSVLQMASFFERAGDRPLPYNMG